MSGIDINTMLMLHCDGADGSTSFPDSSLSPKTVTAISPGQVDTAQFKFGGASFLGDGLSSGLTSADNAAFEFSDGDFTIDCWVRFNTTPAAALSVFAAKYTTTGAQRCFYWGYQENTATMDFRYSNDGAASTLLSQSWAPSLATWYHLAVVRSSLAIRMFVDGVQLGAGDAISGALFNGSGSLTLGTFNEGTGGWLDGWLDEIRISNLARWTSNFTPPAAAYSFDTPPTSSLAWVKG